MATPSFTEFLQQEFGKNIAKKIKKLKNDFEKTEKGKNDTEDLIRKILEETYGDSDDEVQNKPKM